MDYPRLDILFHWLTNTPELLQRACVVVVATYLAIRLEWFRRAMRGVKDSWRCRLIAALFFGMLAIFGTYNGIVLDAGSGDTKVLVHSLATGGLQNLQAVLGFRDMLVMSAGLAAGPWVGLGAGLLAGCQRYYLGGFVALSAGVATVCVGLMAGLARQFWANAVVPKGTLAVAVLISGLQKLIVVLLSRPMDVALAVIQETVIPETAVNCIGCLLFLSVLQDLERERLQALAQQAELRALQAQVEPHFVNNTLNAIKTLIGRDPQLASAYVVKLARFFDVTRLSAKANSISLGEELDHLECYIEFQQLRFPGVFSFNCDVPYELRACRIPPRSLLTLAENALLHGRRGMDDLLDIRLSAIDSGEALVLSIIDNGCGLLADQIETLGRQPVVSLRGSGNGLYQLNESLKLAFGNNAKLAIANGQEAGCEVTLTLPKRSEPW